MANVEGVPPSRLSRTRVYPAIIAALMVTEAMAAFESGMIYLALPTLMRELDAGVSQAAWVVTIYFLVAAIGCGICGGIGDRFGRKRIVLWLIATATIGSFISLVGDSLFMVVLGRAMQGASGAVLPLAIAIARSAAPNVRAGATGMSAVSASLVIGGSAGAVFAGVALDILGWHSIFVVSGVLGIISFVAVYVVVPSDNTSDLATSRVDYVGAALLAPAITFVLLALTNGPSRGWTSASVVGMASAGVFLALLWAWWELRTEDPLIQLRDFANRHMALALVVTMAAVGLYSVLSVVNSLVMQGRPENQLGLGLSGMQYGLMMCVNGLVVFAALPIIGRIVPRAGGGPVLSVAAAISLVSLGLYSFGYNSLPLMALVLLLGSFASFFVTSALPIVATEVVPVERTASTVGAYSVVRAMMTSAFSAVTGVLLASSIEEGTRQPDVTALHRVLMLVTACAVVTLVAGLMLRLRRTDTTTDKHESDGIDPSSNEPAEARETLS